MKNNKSKFILIFILFLLISSFFQCGINAFIVYPGRIYQVDNIYYSVTIPIDFDNITRAAHWISFNGIGFNITASVNLYVNFSSIASHPKSSTGWLLNWTSQKGPSSTAYYWINGLKPLYSYTFYSNGSSSTKTTKANGSFQINQTSFNNRLYQIYDPGIPSSGWYVSLLGSDSTGTGTLANPFYTLRKAINASSTGDTIYMRGGDYTQPGWDSYGTIKVNRSGTAASHLTISAYGSEKVVIDGKLKTISSGYGMIRLYYSIASVYYCQSNITIYGINFSNCSGDCIYAAGLSGGQSCNNLTFSHCAFFNITKHVFYFNNPNYPSVWMKYININNCSFNHVQSNGTTTECVSFIGTKYYVFENCSAKEFVKQFINAGGAYGNIRFNSFKNRYYFTIKFDPSDNGDYSAQHINIYNNLFYGNVAAASSPIVAIYFNPENIGGAHLIHDVNIYNNIFNLTAPVGSNYYGIELYPLHSGDWIYNVNITYNTFYVGGSSSNCLRFRENSKKLTSIVAKNNLFMNHNSSTNQVYFYDLPKTQTNVTMGYNCYNKTNGKTIGCYYTTDSSDIEATSINASPKITSISTPDFHLNSTSPCVDSATSSYTVPTDYDKNIRPQYGGYDVGAYERTGTVSYTPSFVFSGIAPTNGSTGIAKTPWLSYTIHETHGYKFNFTIKENTTGAWVDLANVHNYNNVSTNTIDTTATAYSTIYWWKITAVNGTTWHNETYHFTTTAPTIPAFIFSSISPANTSTGVSLTPTLSYIINESHGYKFNYTIKGNSSGTYTTLDSGALVSNTSSSVIYMGASSYSHKYYWKIIAWNGTTYNNATYYFTTLSAPTPGSGLTVSKIKANWTTNVSVYLSWTKGALTTNTYIYRKQGSYITSRTDPLGVNIYAGTNNYFNDTLLNPTLRYFYTLYPYNSSSGSYGASVNASLGETDNTTTTSSSTILFKGYLSTDRSMKMNFHYATNPSFTGTTTNTTIKTEYCTDDRHGGDDVEGTKWEGQSFTVGNNGPNERYYLYNVSFCMERFNNPGTVYLYLYEANSSGAGAGLPTGSILASGSADSSIYLDSGYYYRNITLSPYYLKSSTKYVIMAKCSGSGVNFLEMGMNYISPSYTGGKTVESTDGGVTFHNHTGSWDSLFILYGHVSSTYTNGLMTSNSTITSSSSTSITQNSLTSGKMYWYYEAANDTKGNMTKGNTRYTLTNPDKPVYQGMQPYFSNHTVKISWIKGNGANRTLAVLSNSAYPDSVTDGIISYNGTSTSCWANNISFNTTYCFSLFSYTSWADLHRFSSSTHIPWGGITVMCYNESKPWQKIRFNMTVTDSLGLYPIQFVNIIGYYNFNITEIPYGSNTLFYVSNNSYNSRLYPIDIVPNVFYNLSFYLPPLKSPSTGTTYGNISASYVVQIINEENQAVNGAQVKFYRYLNTTANYTYIGGFVSDGNGEGSINLFPFQLYMVRIYCTGYSNSTYFWNPNVDEQTNVKIFKIYVASSDVTNQKMYDDYVSFHGSLNNASGLLSITYNDTLSSTTDWTVLVYSMNADGTQTLIYTNTGTNSSFTLGTHVVTTLDYHVIINVNHSLFGSVSDDFTLFGYHGHLTGKAEKFNMLMLINFGFNPFGWTNTALMIIGLGIFFSFGRRETYLSVIMLGVIVLFLDIYIGLSPNFIASLFGGFFPVLLIFLGILMLIRDRGMFGAS